jgi:hypothetical protein
LKAAVDEAFGAGEFDFQTHDEIGEVARAGEKDVAGNGLG